MEISQIAEVYATGHKLATKGQIPTESLSYCNGVIKKPFQPEFFKLGDPTPGQANDCSGTHFIVDNRLDLDKGCLGAAEGYSKRLPEIVHENPVPEEICIANH